VGKDTERIIYGILRGVCRYLYSLDINMQSLN